MSLHLPKIQKPLDFQRLFFGSERQETLKHLHLVRRVYLLFFSRIFLRRTTPLPSLLFQRFDGRKLRLC
jgi:hypothetical protein